MQQTTQSQQPRPGAPGSGRAVIIGAGPAGLTAAWELARLKIPAVLFESDSLVGGIAQTVNYKGYRFDIGGHRFFTKVDMVQKLWEEVLGDDLIQRGRLSRIYYGGNFFDYPLKPVNALLGLGPVEAARIGFSYLKAQMFPLKEERNFEQWVSNRFGRRLYEIFFKTYTEKVWGIPCTEIGADWAAQRIKNLDLLKAVKNALLGSRAKSKKEVITTLIDAFHYPRLGPGMMWERFRDKLADQGYHTHMRHKVTKLHHQGGRIVAVDVVDADGRVQREVGEHFISSMPIRNPILGFDPPAPPEVLEAARRLRYRDFLSVVLIVDNPELFPDNWIYIHSADVKLGRIQNFKNWSPEMVPDPSKTALGLEYFVQEGDELWTMADADLVELGRRECDILKLVRAEEVIDGTVVRVPKAYPVYDQGYQEALATIRSYLEGFPNLQLVGRNGQHRYNNQDHSMVTAIYAARNIAGAELDVWGVNVEEEYHEERREDDTEAGEGRAAAAAAGRAAASGRLAAPGGRAVPMPLSPRDELAELVRSAFARYDAVALGGAVGAVLGVGVFLATAILLLRGGDTVGPNLALLGQYFLGYQVSWTGGLVGMVEAALGGFAFGWLLATAINKLVAWHETTYKRQAQMDKLLEP